MSNGSDPIKPGLSAVELTRILVEGLGLVRDGSHRWDLGLICPPERLREIVTTLRDAPNLRFATLVDMVGIDYLAYPGHRGPRFAVAYQFKSVEFRHRIALKVLVDEETPVVPSLHDLFNNADWTEREVWDQFGIRFSGHPNLKRLLNHHEFVGHPLRKDYPCQKRQKLSINDPMIDQLEARLKERGFTVIDRGLSHSGKPMISKGTDA